MRKRLKIVNMPKITHNFCVLISVQKDVIAFTQS